ncbi:MAG: OmpA family protein [Bacteroidia bacterium]|nr:OmpA family protein [Bacteroidia bacterium]
MIKKYLIVLLIINSGILLGQETRLELADKYFNQFAYNKALSLYKGAEERGADSWKIYARIANCYYNTSRPKEACEYFKLAIDADKNNRIASDFLRRYALSLQSIGAPDSEVLGAFQAYYDRIGKGKMIKGREKLDSLPQSIEKLTINSEFSDFGSFIYNDTLYFSSSRENPSKKRRLNNKLYKWTEEPFLDVYSAAILEDSDSLVLKPIHPDSSDIGFNSNAHESMITISSDKENPKMYFSGGKTDQKGRIKYNKRGTSTLKLRRASWINNRWVETTEDKDAMKFLDYELYSMSSPALSPDNRRLFFVSCAPFRDAKGQTDIFYVDINQDGSIDEEIKALPKGINTGSRESFPFVSKDGSLYFSSDGIYGDTLSLGLLDIYRVRDIDEVISGSKSVRVEHLDQPINSDKDDFAFFMAERDKDDICSPMAYFSSNRNYPDTAGEDNIYRFSMTLTKTVQGQVIDSESREPIPDAFVHLIDSLGMVLKTAQVNSKGNYSFDVECDRFYRLRASKNYFYDDLMEFDSHSESENVNLALKPFPCEIMPPFLFEYRTAELSFNDKVELLPLIEILLTNPEVTIRIESHTDLRGTEEFNQKLSHERAMSIKDYLINSEVQESQIVSAKGFGERCPIKTEEEILAAPKSKRDDLHRANRRSRFILSICEDEADNCDDQNN